MSDNEFVWDKRWRETAKRVFSELLAHGATEKDIHRIPINEQQLEEIATLLIITRMEADRHTSEGLALTGTVTNRIRLEPSSKVLSIFDAVMYGSYDKEDPDIYTYFRNDFRITRAVDVELAQFDHDVFYYEAILWGKQNGMKPIKGRHIHEIGIQHPVQQCLSPILELGSVHYGEAIYLDGVRDGDGNILSRQIGLIPVKRDPLPQNFRFGFIKL